MKKVIAVITAILIMIPAFSFGSYAAEDKKIVIELRSDIASMTCDDYRSFALIKSDNIVFDETQRSDPLILTDCVGNIYTGKMKAGRTYSIWYTFYAADGFEIPDEMNDDTIEIICGKGVNAFWYGKTVGTGKDGERLYSLSVWTDVRVDGNFFQNIFGRLADLFLKIKSWSPY